MVRMKQTKYEWKDYRESGNMFYWIIQWLCVEIWRRHNERMERVLWMGMRND